MIHKRINLREDGNVYLDTYFWDYYSQKYYKDGEWQPEKRPCFLILPGGGYGFMSDREAEPVALAFNAMGFHCAVLYYSVMEDSHMPKPLEDVSMAVWYLREHAEEYHIRPDAIAVGGFSAGGSLSSILGTQWNAPGLCERLHIPENQNRPDALMLGYAPVDASYFGEMDFTGYDRAHPENNPEPRGAAILDNDPELDTAKLVNENTPPAFIWLTSHDEIVDPRNSLSFAKACLEHNVPCELHMFEHGLHGRALGNDLTDYRAEHEINVDKWVMMFGDWMKKLFDF